MMIKDKVRKPSVAGRFYPGDPEKLRVTVEVFLDKAKTKLGPDLLPASDSVMGLIAPHAGYIYSGSTAAVSFFTVKSSKRDLVMIIGPNHHGYGPEIALSPTRFWETPLGTVEVDIELSDSIIKRGSELGLDIGFSYEAHAFEHSVEVQLPFLQVIWGEGFKLLPIVVKYQRAKDMAQLGTLLAEFLYDRSSLLVASSDMSHYVSHEMAIENDSKTFPYIESMNWEMLYRVVEENSITACGVGAITAVMVSTKMLGAENGKVLEYTTSADASGDYSHVVGYLSAVFFK